MKRLGLLLVLVPAMAFAAGVEIRVQVVPEKPGKASVNLTADQRHVIRENVLTPEIKPERDATNVQAEVGEPAPAGVTLKEFPKLVMEKVPQIRAHRFFLKGSTIVIVSDDNKIADVIQ